MQLGERANGREVIGRHGDHALELGSRLVGAAERLQRAAERDPGRQVRGMPVESGKAHGNRVVEAARSPVLLGERAKCDGGRVLLDPALQFLDARRQKVSPARRKVPR